MNEQVTQLLENLGESAPSPADALVPLVYEDLRHLAADYLQRELPGHTLQPSALVNEAYLKLVDQKRVNWRGKTHFIAVAAQVMRRLLVDHARQKQRIKRGGGRHRVVLHDDLKLTTRNDEDLLAVDEAIERLAEVDPRQAKIVELRFFGGMTVEEAAQAMGLSKRTVEAEWTMIRAWLRRELSEEESRDETGEGGVG